MSRLPRGVFNTKSPRRQTRRSCHARGRMNAPQISVVIATQNSASYLCPCLDSLRNQDQSAAAEIIVADASTDGSAEIIRGRYPDLLILHFDRPLVLPRFLREALPQARGQIIPVTVAYCQFPPKCLADLLQ